MRKIIYVLVVVSIAIVNTVFTIRNSDEIVDLVSLKSEALQIMMKFRAVHWDLFINLDVVYLRRL